MADVIRAVLYGVLPALGAALLLVGLLGTRWLGVANGLGLLVTLGLLKQRRPLWPHELWAGNNDAMLWLCWGALAVGLLAALHPRRELPGWLAVPSGLACIGGNFWLVLVNPRKRWEVTECVLQHEAAIAVAAVGWLSVRRAIGARPGPLMAWALSGCLAGDAALLHFSGSTLQGQLGGAVATAFAAAAGTALWRHPFVLDRTAALPFAAIHGGLLLTGVHLSELGPVPAVLAGVAPCALVLCGAANTGTAGAMRFLLGFAGMVALLGSAVWLTQKG